MELNHKKKVDFFFKFYFISGRGGETSPQTGLLRSQNGQRTSRYRNNTRTHFNRDSFGLRIKNRAIKKMPRKGIMTFSK